ncbi:hypothetical protein ACFX2I_013440 [Malus domestica]
MRRFLQSLELFEENERKKLAIFTALAFSQKLSGLPPETVFQPMLKDNLVGKGLRGKVEDNLLEFFPSAKRTEESFSEHFTKEWLVALVEYNEKKIFEVKLKEMKSALTTQITEETDMSEVIETVKQRVKDAKLPDVVDPISSLFKNLMDYAQGKQVFDESPERECNGDFEYSKLGDDASRICASNDGEDLDSGELIHFCCCKLLHLCHIDFDLRSGGLYQSFEMETNPIKSSSRFEGIAELAIEGLELHMLPNRRFEQYNDGFCSGGSQYKFYSVKSASAKS